MPTCTYCGQPVRGRREHASCARMRRDQEARRNRAFCDHCGRPTSAETCPSCGKLTDRREP